MAHVEPGDAREEQREQEAKRYEPLQVRPWGQWVWYTDARGGCTWDASDLPDAIFRRLSGGESCPEHRVYPTREAALRALQEAKGGDQ